MRVQCFGGALDGYRTEVAIREGETQLFGMSMVVGNGYAHWIHNAHAVKHTAAYVLFEGDLVFMWMETKGK